MAASLSDLHARFVAGQVGLGLADLEAETAALAIGLADARGQFPNFDRHQGGIQIAGVADHLIEAILFLFERGRRFAQQRVQVGDALSRSSFSA